MLKAVLLDDEYHCTSTLEILLKEHCKDVQIVQVFNDSVTALAYLRKTNIDVLFLDVEMPYYNGFELLNELKPVSFQVIFVTAYDKFAIKAFKYSAFDYLLKPVDEEELIRTVHKLQYSRQNHGQMDMLMEMIDKQSKKVDKIALPSSEGLEFVHFSELVRCESDSNYTKIILADGRYLMITKTLKELTDLLQDVGFVRIHNSHLINPKHIKRFIKSAGGFLILTDGEEVPISRQKKEQVLEILNSI